MLDAWSGIATGQVLIDVLLEGLDERSIMMTRLLVEIDYTLDTGSVIGGPINSILQKLGPHS